MPTYDYECLSCGYIFEKFQNITDETYPSCPKCNNKTKKLIGAGCGLIFKGSGFYITDYKKKSAHLNSHDKKDTSTSNKSQRENKSQKEDKNKQN